MVERIAPGSNLITNLTEFLSENWAMGLYHEWFSEFRYNLKVRLTNNPELKKLLDEVGDHALGGKYMDRETFKKWDGSIGDSIKQLVRVSSQFFQPVIISLGQRFAICQ